MSRAVIKFSSEDCGICHKMSFYDQKVSEELGLQFIDVKMQFRSRLQEVLNSATSASQN